MPRLLSLILASELLFAPIASAQSIDPAASVTKTTTPAAAPASAPNAVTATPIGLDLSSATRSMSATALLHGTQTAVINVGGAPMMVSPASQLTSAQYAALSQVLAGQAQALHISPSGVATGGSLCLSCALPQQQLTSLVVPKGVRVINDFGASGALNVAGSIVDSGAFYAVSTKANVLNAIINAQNLAVNSGGLLTSVLPSGGLAGFQNAIPNLALTLNVAQTLHNEGVISSAANLNISSPNIFNSGLISSQYGNVNILNAAQMTGTDSGIIQALTGTVAINGTGTGDVHVAGGSIFGKDVVLNAGYGLFDLSLRDASGNFSVTAGAAKLAVLDGTHGFNLVGVNTLDDPDLIFNGTGNYTSAAFNSLGGIVDITTTGSISFTGAINTTPTTNGPGGYVNLNAGTTINTGDIITTGKTNGNAGPITLTAGGAITTGNLTALGVGPGADGIITINSGSTLNTSAIKGDAISLTSKGNIVSGTITGNSLSVSSGTGNFGSSATPVNTAVGSFAVNTTGSGSAYITQTGALNLNASTLGGDLVLTTNTNFALNSPVSAANLTIKGNGTNNSITINSNPTVPGVINLGATGTGKVIAAPGVLMNPQSLVMSSGSGSFGSAGTPFEFASKTIKINTTGSAYLTSPNAGAVQLSASTVGGTLAFVANGNIATTGAVVAPITTFQSTATNGGITLNGDLTGTTSVTLTATGTGNIDTATGTIITPSLVMSTGTGDIGKTAFVNTAASNITANTGGNIQIQQTGATTLQPSNAGNNFFFRVNAPSFTLNNAVSAGASFILTGTGTNTSIIINTNPTVGSQFGVLTAGNGTLTENVVITAPTVSITTGSADLGSLATPFQVSTSKLNLTAGANAYVSNNLPITILGATATGAFNLQNNGDITVGGTTSGKTVVLQPTSANGNIIIGANLTGSTSSQLTATGTGTITRTGGAIGGGIATLTTAGGAIGTLAAPIKILGATVDANAGAGAIFLDAQSDSTFRNISSGTNINIVGSGGRVTTSGAITAPTISLQSSASGININSNVTATTSITVTASNAGGAIGGSGGLLTAPTVSLSAVTGDIGSSGSPINTATSTLTAKTGGTGSVYVVNTGNLSLGNSGSGNLLQVATNGDLHVTGTLTSPSLNLTTTANNGSLVIDTAINAPTGLTLATQGTGSITLSQAVVTTPTTTGNGGAVSITAGDAFNYTSITTTANGTTSGIGGGVNIAAGGLVTGTGAITTGISAANQGVAPGSISISGKGVNVQNLNTSSTVGDAGSISVVSSGVLSIANAYANAAGDGGTISLSSSGATPLTVTGVLDSHSASSTSKPGRAAGDINLSSVNGINVIGNIDMRTAGGKAGGLTANNTGTGDINLPSIDSSSLGQVALGYNGLLNPSGGDIILTQSGTGNINVNGAINTSGINTSFGGNVGVRLAGGALTVTRTINTTSAIQTGGHVDIGGTASAVSINTLGVSTDTAIDTEGGGSSEFYAGNVRIIPTGAVVNVTGDIVTKGNGGALSAGLVVNSAQSINIAGNIITSNGSSQGGNVLLQASGSVTAGDITANGANGSGGIISVAAGTDGIGDLVLGNLSSTGSGLNQTGGSTTLTSNGNLTVGTITANGTGSAFGGAITLVSGYQPTGVLPGGAGDITYGNISSTGAWGGNVSVVSLGTSGNINNPGSTITTNASGLNGIAGSVGISSPGVIDVGGISTQSMNGANAYAGSVLVSSGAAGNALTVSSINTSSSGTAGNVFLIVNPTSTLTDNPATITQTGTTTNTISGTTSGYLFDNPAAVTPTTAISGVMTANFGTTVSGYNPGGYLTASDPTAQLTVNTNGDARLFVPLSVLQGGAAIQTLTSQSTTLGANTYASPLALYARGDVTITNPVSAISVNAPAAPVNFVSTTGAVSIPSLTIQGDPAAQVVLSSPTNFTLTNGSSIFNSANGTGGLVTISVPNGSINLGTPGNFSSNTLEANGTTGGIISLVASGDIVDYGVAINATGTTGNGGTVHIASNEGAVKFYNEYSGGSTIPAGINVSSVSGDGGTINIYGRYGISVLADGTASTPSTHLFQANGSANGGSITLSAPSGDINLTDNQAVTAKATAAGGTAGSMYLFSPFNSVTVNTLDASSDNGGSIRSISSKFFLSNANNITADGTNGLGGTVFLYTGGVKVGGNDITLGTADNRTGNLVSARGTTGGGTVTVAAGGSLNDYEVGITTDTTGGTGGTTNVYAGSGDVKLYSSWWNNGVAENHNAFVSANNANGAGGTVNIDGHNVLSLQDSSNGLTGNTSTHAITANGTTAGGAINITGGNINLGTTDQILATGSLASSTGGSILIKSSDADGPGSTTCCYSNATSIISAIGGQIGGTIDIESTDGHIDLVQTSKITTSAPGTTGGTTIISAPKSYVTVNNISADVPGSTINISAGGTLHNVGTITGDVVDMRTVANSGTITLGAPVNGRTSVTMVANSSGSIENTAGFGGGLITAPTVNLTSQGGHIGQITGGATPPANSQDPLFVFLNATNLTVNAGTDIYLNSVGSAVSLVGSSSSGTGNNKFYLESNGTVNIPGTVNAGSLVNYSGACCNGYSWVGTSGQGSLHVETYGGAGDINITGTATGHGEAEFITAGTGMFNLNAGASINSEEYVMVQSYGANIQGTIYAQNVEHQTDPNGVLHHYYDGYVLLVPNGSQSVAIGDTTGTTATFDIPQSVFSRITTEELQIGTSNWNGTAYVPVNTGDIKLYGDVNIANTLGSPGSYSLYIFTGGSFDGTGYKVSLSTGAEDYHMYEVDADNNVLTGSSSGGYYQYFSAGKTLTVNGTLDNTNSAYGYNQISLYGTNDINVLPTGVVNSGYASMSSPIMNVDGSLTGSLQTSLNYSSYLANNVAQPTYGLTLSGTGSLNGATVYISNSHYTYDPVTFASTFLGGKVTGTIGQINAPLSAYAQTGTLPSLGSFSLYTTNGNMQVRDVTTGTVALGTDGAHALTVLSTSGYPTTLTAKTIHLTSGTVMANIGLNATAGGVTIDSPAGFGLTVGSTKDALPIASTAANTIQASSGTLVLQNSITAGTQTLNLIANGVGGALSVTGTAAIAGSGVVNVQTPSVTIAPGAGLSGATLLALSSAGSPMTITNNGSLSSSKTVTISNNQDITITGGASSVTSAPTISVTTTGGAINLGSGLTAATGMTLTSTNGVTSTNTITGLATPVLTIGGGTGAISIAGTSATTLTANTTGAVGITDTAKGVVTLNPSSGSSFRLTASDAASGIAGTGLLNAATVDLSAGTAGIDYSTAGTLNANVLNANSTGATTIRDTFAGQISLGNSSAGSTFTLNASAGAPGALVSGIVATGLLSAPTVSLTAGSGGIDFATTGSMNASTLTVTDANGAVVINNSYAGVATLNASSATAFTMNATNAAGGIAGGGVLTAGTVVLGAGTGGIDFSSNGSLTASNVTLNAPTGNVTVNDSFAGNITLNASSANNFTLTATNASGGITANGALTAGSASLTAGTGGLDFSTSGSTNASSLIINDSTGNVVLKNTFAGIVSLAAGSAASLNLQATDAAGGITGTGAFASPTVSLSAGSGGIDFSSASSLNAKSLTINTPTGNATVTDTFAGVVTVNASNASNLTLNATAAGAGILANGAIATNSINLTAGSSGIDLNTSGSTNASNITVSAPTGTVTINDTFAGAVTVNAGTSKTFTMNASNAAGGIVGNGALSSSTVNLTAGTGGIDFATNGSLDAKTLTISDATGTVSINDTFSGVVSLGAGSAGSLNLTASDAAGGITGTGAFNSQTVALAAGTGGVDFRTSGSLNAQTLSVNAPTGSVRVRDTFNGVVSLGTTSATSLIMDATSAGGGISTTGTVTAPSITFNAGSGGITSTVANPIVATTVVASSTGAVSLVDSATSQVNVSGNANTFGFQTTAADLNVSSAITGSSLNLRWDTGNIRLSAALGTAATTDITLNAAQAIVNNGSTISGGALSLTAGGDVGATNNRLTTAVDAISTTSAANEYISNSGAVNVGATNATGVLDLINSGDITVNGAVTANGVTFRNTSGSNGGIAVGANLNSTGAIKFTTDGTGSVSISAPTATTNGGIDINTGALNLNSTLTNSDAASGISVHHTTPLTLSGVGSMAASSIDFQAPSMTVGANAAYALTNGSQTNITTNTLTFGSASSLNSTNAQGFDIGTNTGSILTFVAPDNSTGTLSTAGGAINMNAPGGTVRFNKSAGPNTATLALNGGPTNIDADTVTVASGVSVQSNNNLNLTSGTTQNAGVLSAAQQLAITNAAGVSVTGAGIMGGATLAFNSANGAVAVTQGQINGIAGGAAGTGYSITTSNNNLNVSSTTANNGSVSLLANGFNLNVVDNSAINASADVNLTAGQMVTLGTKGGTNVSVRSGTIDPLFNANSTNRADFNISAVLTAGATMISSGTGIVLGDNVSIRSVGDSIGILAQTGDITFGNGAQLFAQAGNIWLNTTNGVDLGTGANFTAVARDMTSGTFNITSVGDITNFRGGNIGINVGALTPNYDSWLRTTFDAARERNGIMYTSPGVTKTNVSSSVPHGGTVNFTQTGPGKIILTNSSFTADGGVIQIDPPGSGVSIVGATFSAIGPELTPLPPVPPAPTPTPAVVTPTATPIKLVPNLTSLTTELQSIAQGSNARTVALDQTKVVNFGTLMLPTDGQQCAATYVPPYAEGGWSVAAGACQSFAVKDDNDSAIIGGGGAQLSSEGSHNINLKKGSMVAMSGHNGLTVTTSRGAVVEIPAESSVMVEETENGVVRVVQLSGQQTSINLKSKDKTTSVSTTAGQEVVIADDDASDEELIPVDGVERIAVAATLKFAGSQIKHNKFDTKKMIEQTKMLNCHNGCFPTYIRKRIDKTRAAAMGPESSPLSENTSSPNALRPISYVTPPAVAAKPAGNVVSLDSDIAVVKHLGAKFTMLTPEEMRLEHGEIAVNANKQLTIHAGQFTASIAKGVIATARYVNNVLQIRNISDSTPHAVSVRNAKRTMDIPVGGEVMLADTSEQLDKALEQDDVGRRKIRRAELDGAAVMSSEISFLSVITESRLLNKLYLSEEEDDKDFRHKVTKTAVIMSIVTAKHGTYAPIK